MTATGGPPVARPSRPAGPSVTAWPDVLAALDRVAEADGLALVVADFDGTLAPGTRDPAAARIEPLAQRALRRLAAAAATRPDRLGVVVLTGRTVDDVVTRARVGGVEYLGDHGLQRAILARRGRPGSLRIETDPGFERHRDPAETLAAGVAAELGQPAWLFVERKGPSVAFHVRQADDVPAARAAVLAAIGAVEAREGLVDHGLAPYRGRSVVDLRPEDAGGKREAVERLIARRRPGALLALGDEVSDIDAFEAVIAARDDGVVQVGVTIAVHASDGRPAPDELLECADLRIASAHDVGRVLSALARRLGAG